MKKLTNAILVTVIVLFALELPLYHLPVPTGVVTQTLLNSVKEMIDGVRVWAPLCTDYKYPFPSKQNCNDGDNLTENGLVCFSGEEIGCKAPRDSLDKDGRIWRSPRRINKETENSASRDQLYGALFYIIHTKDKEYAERMYGYISKHFLICPDATDNRCIPVPEVFGSMRKIWSYIGLRPHFWMYVGELMDDNILLVEAITNPPGYRLGLVDEAILFRQATGSETVVARLAAMVIAHRQPRNPLFNIIAYGASDAALNDMMNQIPKTEPVYKDEWSVERDTAEKDYERSMGWEWITVYNLLSKRLK